MSEQEPTKKSFWEKKYRISRSVSPSGEPLYVLSEDISFNNPFGCGTKSNKLAENRDRQVLEQAVTFLEVGE